MKKLLVLCLAVLMTLSLAACGKKEEAAVEEDKQEVQKLVVGFDAEFPPFGYVAEDGSYDGFDLALAKEACDRLGWEFEAVAIDWNAKDAELSSGNITCIWNGFTINGREDQYTWSDAYVDNSIVVVVKEGAEIATLNDLEGKDVMVQAGSSGADALAESDIAGLVNVISLPDYNQGFMELNQGSVVAVVVDLGVAKYQMANNSGNTYKILDETIANEQYGVGFLKGNTEVCAAINEQLKAMAADGTMVKIAENYVEEGLVLDSLCLVK